MKPFKASQTLAGLVLALCSLAPPAVIAQDLDELKSSFDELSFQYSEEVLDWLVNSDYEGLFQMVNLLKFRSQAEYPEDYEGERGTGLDAQQRYAQAMLPLVKELGVRSVVRNRVVGTAVWLGENEDWDMVTVMYYPSRAAFVKMVTSQTFLNAEIHKRAALEQNRTVVTLPGGPIVDPAKAPGM